MILLFSMLLALTASAPLCRSAGAPFWLYNDATNVAFTGKTNTFTVIQKFSNDLVIARTYVSGGVTSVVWHPVMLLTNQTTSGQMVLSSVANGKTSFYAVAVADIINTNLSIILATNAALTEVTIWTNQLNVDLRANDAGVSNNLVAMYGTGDAGVSNNLTTLITNSWVYGGTVQGDSLTNYFAIPTNWSIPTDRIPVMGLVGSNADIRMPEFLLRSGTQISYRVKSTAGLTSNDLVTFVFPNVWSNFTYSTYVAPDTNFAQYTVFMLHFDGTNNSVTFTDSSTNGLTNTVSGIAKITNAPAHFGTGVARFDGSTGYVTWNTNVAFNMSSNACTIEFWVWVDTDRAWNYPSIIANSASWVAGTFGIRFDNAGTKKYGVFWNPNDPLMAGIIHPFDRWDHVALTRSASGTNMTLWVNGTNEVSAYIDGNRMLSFANPLCRMGYGEWDGANGQFFGWVDELRVLKGIAAYTTNFSVPTGPYSP